MSDTQLHLQAHSAHYRLDVLKVQQQLSASGVPERLTQPVWAASCGPCRRSSSSSCSGSSPACRSSSAPRISQPAAASSSRLQDDNREERERLQQLSKGFSVWSPNCQNIVLKMEIKAASKSHLFYLSISCIMSVWSRGLNVQRISISIRQNISSMFVRTELALTVLEEERLCALIGSFPLQPLEVQLSLSLLLSARPRSLLVLLQRNSQSVRRTSPHSIIQPLFIYSFSSTLSHHPLQQELQFLRPLVVVLCLVQLLLDDLQTNVIKTSFYSRAAPQISPIWTPLTSFSLCLMSLMNLNVFSKISGLYSPDRSSNRGSLNVWAKATHRNRIRSSVRSSRDEQTRCRRKVFLTHRLPDGDDLTEKRSRSLGRNLHRPENTNTHSVSRRDRAAVCPQRTWNQWTWWDQQPGSAVVLKLAGWATSFFEEGCVWIRPNNKVILLKYSALLSKWT